MSGEIIRVNNVLSSYCITGWPCIKGFQELPEQMDEQIRVDESYCYKHTYTYIPSTEFLLLPPIPLIQQLHISLSNFIIQPLNFSMTQKSVDKMSILSAARYLFNVDVIH